MYRNQKISLIFSVFVLLLSGFTSSVFAIDFSNALKQSAQDTQTASSLFDGKATIGDLYNQALKVVKQNESSATDQSINRVVTYFTKQSCTVSAQDIIHILYVSNLWFKTFFDQQVLSSITSTWSLPTPASINASYFRFFACEKIQQPTADDFVRVQKNLITLYYQSVNGVFYSSTLAQDNVGEDLFRNGNADDSAFDLMVDINDIGNIFFSSFKQAPEVLFYRLPKAVVWWSHNGWTPGSGSPIGNGGGTGWSLDTTWGEDTWVRGIGVPPSPAPLWSTPATSSADALISPATVSQDADVQQFLTTNNPSTFVQPGYGFLVGNACADVAKLPSSQAAVQEATQDPQTYMSWLIDFIADVDTDTIVQAVLLSWFTKDLDTINTPNPTATLANDYAEIAFGGWSIGAGSCESACVPLTWADAVQCQLGCAKSCIQTCDSLPLDDKILCVTDCSCKMISGPKWAEWKSIEDMFSVKFCKEPVKQVSTPAKKNVSNIEGILTAIADVLQWLKSSGNTIKEKKTKEFLDLWISLNLADLLDFKIFFAFKPIFAQKSSAAEQRKQTIEAARLAQATLGMASNPASENYNKYVIVSDIAKNKAELQPVWDPNNSAALFDANQQLASLHNPVELYQQQKNALLSEDIITFLKSHITFWDQFFSVTTQMMLDATTLKTKIENGK